MTKPLTAPILLIAYARPKTTRVVFDRIRTARPEKLYLAVDGPPPEDESKKRQHAEVRDIIAQVDWPCQVQYKINPVNLGMREGVSTALDWFFSCEPEGIVLEDDCMPSPDFFVFCDLLLPKYREDRRIAHISGTNLQFGVKRGNASYYFGQIPSIWGWAGWRRVWQQFSLEMKSFPTFLDDQMMKRVLPEPALARRLETVLQATHDHRVRTWDHQYGYSIVINNGLCIHPNVNLISNLGNRVGDEPEKADPSAVGAIPVRSLLFPLTHPKIFVADLRADMLQASWTPQDDSRDIPRRVIANNHFVFQSQELSKRYEQV